MDRRKALKTLALGTAVAPVMMQACAPAGQEKTAAATADAATADRMQEEIAYNKTVEGGSFFNAHELATIAVLSNVIIPKDEVSGSATDAGVPAFIHFMAKDKPELQTPLRGGLRWIDLTSLKQHGQPFKDCTAEQQLQLVTAIAYPSKTAPDMMPGSSFFTLMRNLTITGFYTSEIGIKDLGYMGNVPNQWNGVPGDILNHYGLAYSAKEIEECIQYT